MLHFIYISPDITGELSVKADSVESAHSMILAMGLEGWVFVGIDSNSGL